MTAPASLGRWLALAALVVGAAGCGGDEEKESGANTTGSESEPARTGERTEAPARGKTPATEPSPDSPTSSEPEPASPTPEATSREDEQGGAGDEEPARSQALFTGKGGRIVPPVVRVPAFIAIRVVLRSADGQSYGLRFGADAVATAEQQREASTTLDGLRPGEAIVGRPFGHGSRVRIEATAEPGP